VEEQIILKRQREATNPYLSPFAFSLSPNKNMKLSIITINYNNAEGLRKTLASVAAQTYPNIEHIIVDGNSTDGSVDVIREYESTLASSLSPLASSLKWLSEPDKGIYNAMNKGLEVALGKRVVNDDHSSSPIANSPSPIADTEYIQILNSGDILAAPDVTYKMVCQLNQYDESVGILYGNMIKVNAAGKVVGKSGYTEYSLRQFYSSTLNHDCAYIRRDLFEEYGLYDEQLKIVSDWKWYLQAIGLGKVKPEYVDIDVTIFDDGGISETNLALRNAERRKVLEEVLPPAVLWDYDTHAFEMEQMKRLRRWKLYGLVYFMERVCFKFEKWFCRR
jgi:glycosyltransferase involved in cell wall biosynthesis